MVNVTDKPINFWDIANWSKLPDLPKVKIKKGKRTYAVTDIRYLNRDAVSFLTECIAYCVENDNADSVCFVGVGHLREQEWKIISDILMAISTSVKARGGDYSEGCFLVCGFEKIANTVTVKLVQENAHYIHEYAKTVQDRTIDFFKCAMYVADRSCEDFAVALQSAEA